MAYYLSPKSLQYFTIEPRIFRHLQVQIKIMEEKTSPASPDQIKSKFLVLHTDQNERF